MKFDYYNREVETLDPDRLRSLQEERLRALMGELAHNRFYAEKFSAAGLAPQAVTRLEDLPALPFTTKRELAEEQRAHPPFGRIAALEPARYRYMHQTSGTTGSPLRWLDTEETWEWWLRCWGAVYRAAGIGPGDRVYCAFSFGPYISHWAAMAGAWHVGAMAIPGGGMNSEQRLRAILDNRCTAVVCTPTYALHLIEVAHEKNIDLRGGGVRVGIHAGEPGASLPNVRRRIEEGWGMLCFDHAGATEVGAWAFDCQARSGAIHLNEAEFIFEVIDPATGEAVGEGERGELVVTNLGRAAMPVVRYRTGDLVELTREPCACGRGFARIRGGVLGRADEMIIVRGVNLYPGALDDVMRSFADVVEYEVEIRRADDMDDLLIRVEAADGASFDNLRRALLDEIRYRFNIRVGIEPAPPGSLPRYELKARRFKRRC